MYNFGRIASRKGSGSLKWTAMAEHNGNLDPEITPFSAADMEFKNAPEIIQAIKDFLDSDNGVLAYYGGYPAYYEAVVDWMERRHGWKIKPEWIVDMNGVLPALYVALASFTKPGDNVIIISPVYDPFYSIVGNISKIRRHLCIGRERRVSCVSYRCSDGSPSASDRAGDRTRGGT